MKTYDELKAEKIKADYEQLGFKWNQIDRLISENGVLVLPTPDLKYKIDGYENLLNDKERITTFGKEGLKIIPSSLKGLYNNNGWTRIEADGSNLPEVNDEDYILGTRFDDGSFEQFRYYGNQNTFKHYEVESRFHEKEITHYKPIEKSLPPLV